MSKSERFELSSDIWDRQTHFHELGWPAFYTIFLICTAIALTVTGVMAYEFMQIQINPWITLLIGLVGGFGGIFITMGSDKAPVSFLGLMLLASSFGIMMSTTLQFYAMDAEKYQYDLAGLLVETGMLTATATGIMGILGYVFADFFIGLGGMLFGALSGLIVLMFGQIILSLFGYHFEGIWISWVAVIIFCGYIGHDIGRLRKIERTADNAIDGALALYLDIINLFLHILRIMAKSKRK